MLYRFVAHSFAKSWLLILILCTDACLKAIVLITVFLTFKMCCAGVVRLHHLHAMCRCGLLLHMSHIVCSVSLCKNGWN